MHVATHTFDLPAPANARASAGVCRIHHPDTIDPGQTLDPACWLSGEELERHARFRVQHARDDFLAGRIAAKSALAALVPDAPPQSWEIVGGIWRQPCVRGPAAGWAVTLAHADGAAVAVAHDDRWMCGLDLEREDRDAADVVRSQVSPAEAEWAETAPADESRWMLLWTAREAIGKAAGTGLLMPECLPATHHWRRTDDAAWRAAVGESELLAILAVCAGGWTLSWLVPGTAADAPTVRTTLRWFADRLRETPAAPQRAGRMR